MASESASHPRFFTLQEAPHWTPYDVEVDQLEPINVGDAPACPQCGDVVGMLTWLPPYRVHLILHGDGFGDFLETTGHSLLVSERFAQAFHAEGLTGLEGFHPAEVLKVRRRRRGPKHTTVPTYLVVRARYGPAAVDLARSGVRYDEPPTCEWCRDTNKKAIYGYSLDASTWQGEDVFRPRGLSGCVTVSERFEHFVAKHGFTNMQLTPTEEYVWDPLAPKLESST